VSALRSFGYIKLKFLPSLKGSTHRLPPRFGPTRKVEAA
jgi:hypothetical protein